MMLPICEIWTKDRTTSLWRIITSFTVIFAALAAHAQTMEAPRPGDLTSWRQQTIVGELQLRVNELKQGDTLHLKSGRHEGPIIIRTPHVTIEGSHGTVIDGQGHASVIVIQADGVKLKNLTIRGSGSSHDQVDAGIAVLAVRNIEIQAVRIEDCLFGIDVAGAEDVKLENSHIASKKLELGVRGDAIRLWSSKRVNIIGNTWTDTRDAVVWYSQNVNFERNRAQRARYSVHSMYTKSLIIRDNVFEHNSVGIFIMYGEGTSVLRNVIKHSLGPTGLALGLKETSNVFAQDNSFIYCAAGILVDNSPMAPNSRNWFQNNLTAYNEVGVLLGGTREGNEFRGNIFRGNSRDVDSETRQPSRSLWLGNTWDQYDGFDRNKDGIGDTAFVVRRYGDLLTSSHPSARFFHGSPILVFIELMERLLPLTDPIELATDTQPRLLHEREVAAEQKGEKHVATHRKSL
jgi:nitrous oxidase accessory protein